jgi:DNA modification methylase
VTKQAFKTIYFPEDRTKSGKTARMTISLPAANERLGVTKEFVSFVRRLSSRELRIAIGNPMLEDLEKAAASDGRTTSNLCLKLLKSSYDQGASEMDPFSKGQTRLSLFVQEKPQIEAKYPLFSQTLGLTFRESKYQPIHRWYTYVEGFSVKYVRQKLLAFGSNVRSVYDPFGGCGTTQLEASMLGIPSFYSEINPFLAFVSDVKVNATSKAKQDGGVAKEILRKYMTMLESSEFTASSMNMSLESYLEAFPQRDYFVEKDVKDLLAAKDHAIRMADDYPYVRDLLLLAIASITVSCSNMTRRADLRRRRSDEYKGRVVNVAVSLKAKLNDICEDLEQVNRVFAPMRRISSDAKTLPIEYLNSIDLALTSPPYLNGTNYFRNTKLELWLLDFIKSEKDLQNFTANAIWSGINNVSSVREHFKTFEPVEKVAVILDQSSYDSRIPKLVRGYFSDMYVVLGNIHSCLKENACFILDLGNSRFCGVDVPTDSILCELAEDLGYEILSNQILAKRYSHDKSLLRQVEIVLRKPKSRTYSSLERSDHEENERSNSKSLQQSVDRFRQELPYKKAPYSKRSWGHPLHSLCSYQGKLKPSIAYWLVSQFSESGMTILDPLGGVGTIALEGCLQGRAAITNDLNPFAFTVATAKVSPPTLNEAESGINELEREISDLRLSGADWESANFGLNAKISDYFHERTLEEILKARKYYLEKEKLNTIDAFLRASILHILHGNRPYALSRMSHSITPFYPSGPFVYRSLVQKLRDRVTRILTKDLTPNFQSGLSFNLDFRQLPNALSQPVDRIITSPPFIGLRFDRPNWMRMWFCGWSQKDFHVTSKAFLERQQMLGMNVYSEFFAACSRMLKDDSLLIVHIGASDKYDMASDLVKYSSQTFSLIDIVKENVESIEKHGIRDKGATTFHQFLFLTKK